MSAGHRTPEYLRFIKRERPKWQAQIDAGGVPCRRCKRVLYQTKAWDLGHIIALAHGGPLTPDNVWPEHRACNRRAGQALSVQTRNENKRLFKL